MSVLVVFEAGRAMSWETVAAAQSLGMPVEVALIGGEAAELASKRLARIYAIERALLARYTADGYTAALAQLIEKARPSLVLLPHSYQVRDYAPRLATRLGDRKSTRLNSSHRL